MIDESHHSIVRVLWCVNGSGEDAYRKPHIRETWTSVCAIN